MNKNRANAQKGGSMDTDSMILEILGDFPECDRPEEAE